MLTMHADHEIVRLAVRAGAVGFLLKECSTDEIVDAVSMAARGRPILSPGVAASMLDEVRQICADSEASPASAITRREANVLQLIVDGCSTPEVAARLYISEKTVKNHLAAIYNKLDARNRTQAVVSAVRLGIVHLELMGDEP